MPEVSTKPLSVIDSCGSSLPSASCSLNGCPTVALAGTRKVTAPHSGLCFGKRSSAPTYISSLHAMSNTNSFFSATTCFAASLPVNSPAISIGVTCGSGYCFAIDSHHSNEARVSLSCVSLS